MKNTFVVPSIQILEVFQRSPAWPRIEPVLIERKVGIGVEVGEGFRQGIVTLWFLPRTKSSSNRMVESPFGLAWKEPAKGGVSELMGCKPISGGSWQELSEVDFTLEELSQVDDSGTFIIGIETVGMKSVKEIIQVFPELAFIFQECYR